MTATATESHSPHVQVIGSEDLTGPSGLVRAVRDALPLLFGMALLMSGNGLTSTLLGVRANIEGFSPATTGFILSGFYVGFFAGSMVTPRTIWRVGHVRVFSGLASLASASVLLHVVWPQPATWFLLRAIAGLCLSGLFVTVETWLNGVATNTTRGGLLGCYMVVTTAALGVGQVLFAIVDPAGYTAFVLASVLVSTAVVPVALATVWPPEVADAPRMSLRELSSTAPLGVVGAVISGFTGAAIVGGGVTIYATQEGLRRSEISLLLAGAIIGGLLLQVPIGRWSDTTDRRWVLAGVALIGAVAAAGAAFAGADSITVLAAITTLVGGSSFLLYSLSSAHLNDWIEADRMVAAGAQLVLVYGAGAVTGPLAVAVAIELSGPAALFVLVGVFYAALGLYTIGRIMRVEAVAKERRSLFALFPVGTTPTPVMLSDAPPEALVHEPVGLGEADTDRGDIAYLTLGSGDPVIILADADVGIWDPVLPSFAADGLHATGMSLRPLRDGDQRQLDQLLAVLRDQELPSATLVGIGETGGIVHEFVAQHPDRTSGVVLVGPDPAMVPDPSEMGDRPLLVLEGDASFPDEPEWVADAVADFVRHHVRPDYYRSP